MLNAADTQVRGQNLQGFESDSDRAQRLQLAQMQDELARKQLAQQGSQFGQNLDWNKESFQQGLDWEREKQRQAARLAEEQAWMGALGGGIGGLLGMGGTALGYGLK